MPDSDDVSVSRDRLMQRVAISTERTQREESRGRSVHKRTTAITEERRGERDRVRGRASRLPAAGCSASRGTSVLGSRVAAAGEREKRGTCSGVFSFWTWSRCGVRHRCVGDREASCDVRAGTLDGKQEVRRASSKRAQLQASNMCGVVWQTGGRSQVCRRRVSVQLLRSAN